MNEVGRLRCSEFFERLHGMFIAQMEVVCEDGLRRTLTVPLEGDFL